MSLSLLADMRTRREFLHSSAALLAAGCARTLPGVPSASLTRAARLPIGFSTLGCPEWTWPTILDAAVANGYGSIELRGLLREMDLPKCPELSGAQLAVSKQQL